MKVAAVYSKQYMDISVPYKDHLYLVLSSSISIFLKEVCMGCRLAEWFLGLILWSLECTDSWLETLAIGQPLYMSFVYSCRSVVFQIKASLSGLLPSENGSKSHDSSSSCIDLCGLMLNYNLLHTTCKLFFFFLKRCMQRTLHTFSIISSILTSSFLCQMLLFFPHIYKEPLYLYFYKEHLLTLDWADPNLVDHCPMR